jgi:hypothetical protein
VLFSKPVAAKQEAEARAAGQQVDYLTRNIPKEFRVKLWFALLDLASTPNHYGRDRHTEVLSVLCQRLLRDYGRARLSSARRTWTGDAGDVSDLQLWVVSEANPEELMDVIEYGALVAELVGVTVGRSLNEMDDRYAAFHAVIKNAFHEHKLAWDLVDLRVVERDSALLHNDVVARVLTLLHGQRGYVAVEKQFHDALDELADHNWADALTDANAAVEIALRAVTGHQQGQLPDLLHEARRRGLFGSAEDTRLRKFLTGLTALSDMRNAEADAHGNTSSEESAWLAVHWAGALIVFIVERADRLGLTTETR